MNGHRFTTARIAANLAVALGLVAAMLFSAVTAAYAGAGGVYVQSVSVGGPSGTMTYGTPGDITYEVTVLCAGNGGPNTFTPIVSSVLPNGVTGSFSPSTLQWSNGCSGWPNPQITTLTLHSTSAAAGGIYSFSASVGGTIGSGSLTINGIQLSVVGFNAQNKPYDGNTIAIPILSGVDLSTGVIYPDQVFLDTSNVHATFSSRTVANNKLVTASGFALTGAQASNYTLIQPTTFANITQRDLHIFIDTVQSRVYDGTNAATVTLTTDAVPGDSVTASGTGTFDNKNAGQNKVVTVPFVSLSGPDAGNYNPVTTTATAQANISQRALTVTAAPSTKQYDGSTSSTAVPQITSGVLQGSDTAGFIETFDSKNIGSGKVLTPSGGVSDGNGGNNYSVTFVSNSSGVISPRPLSVSALGINRTYDGSTVASVALSDDRVFGDVFSDSYAGASFTDKHVGTGKSISVSGIAISGADAGNYTLLNTTASASADITARPITVTAVPNTKVYDGNYSAAAIPTIAAGSLAVGDVGNFSEVYADKYVGTSKTLVASGSVSDSNGSNNYSISFVSNYAGVIQAKPIQSVTADNQSILATDALPAFTFHYGATDLVAGDSPSDIDVAPVCGVAVTVPVPAGTYPITCSGGSDANYDFSGTTYVEGALQVTGVNDPPVEIFINGNNNSAPLTPFEFQKAGTLIGMLTDQDPNGGDIATYSLVDGPSCSGADNGIFQIGGSAQDELRISSSVPGGYALDYETQPVLHICIRATDSHSATLDKPFTLNVQNRVGVTVIYPVQTANDGFILENATPPAGRGGSMNSLAGVLNVGDSRTNMQYRSILSFDTSKLPDNAVLTKVTLKMRLQRPVGNVAALGNLLFDVRQPYFGTLATLQLVDFQSAPTLPGVASYAPSSMAAGAWYSIDLNPAALNIDTTKKGMTQIRMAFANATNGNSAFDELQFYSGNAAVAGNRPQLIIEYSLPQMQATFLSDPAVDGQINESLALNGLGGTINATEGILRAGDTKTNQAVRSILSFNTAALPDRAVITSVQLRLVQSGFSGNPFGTLGNLNIDLRQAYFGGRPALEILDFQAVADQLGITTIIPPSPTPAKGTVYTINIDPSLLSSMTVRLSTQLRLRFDNRSANPGVPDMIGFYSGNYTTAAYRPQLIITFSIP